MQSSVGDTAGRGATPLAFGPFRLDARNARLTEGARELELPPKAFAVLCHLAARPGELVTKDELLDAVWGRRFVSESVLKMAVSTIRTVLGDDSRAPRYVETVSRRGYRFVATPVESAPVASSLPLALAELGHDGLVTRASPEKASAPRLPRRSHRPPKKRPWSAARSRSPGWTACWPRRSAGAARR